MGVKMSDMTADTSVAGTEKILVLDGTTSKTLTTAKMAEYAVDVLLAAAAATPTTGDNVVAERSGAEKLYDLDDLAAYCVASAWSVATTVTPAASGDLLLVSRTGTVYDMNVDTLVTYVLATTSAAATNLQAGVLNISGLSAATLANTDLLAICQTTTAKKATIASLETLLWTDYATYVGALTAVATAADADVLYCLQSGVPKKLTLDDLAVYMSAEIISIGDIHDAVLDTLDTYLAALDAVTTPANADLLYCTQGGTAKKLSLSTLANYASNAAYELPWKLIDTGKYTTTAPASTSTITMSDTTDFEKGYPVKFTQSGTTYYAIVSDIAANTLLTISGAPLIAATAITALYVGDPSQVTQMELLVETAYGNTAQDIFSAVTYQRVRWEKGPAYLVSFAATHGVADTGAAQPKINVKVAGNAVSTEDTDKGITLSGTPGTWTANSAVEIDPSYYDIDRGDAIDIRCTEAGTNGDADILSVQLVFVYE